jgi:MYXO-CTERM domain-containing protein
MRTPTAIWSAPLFALLGTFATPALGADFYVDPKSGSMSNDGSSAKPWKTLEEVVAANLIQTQNWESLPYAEGKQLVAKNATAPVKAGDTIWLRSGYHGRVEITGFYNQSPITIAAQAGHTPELASLLIRASKNWKVSGLRLSPTFAPSFEKRTMIDLDSHGWSGPVSEIVVENCELFSATDVSAWTDADWNARAVNGIQADGAEITIRNNQLKNVNFGISVGAKSSLVEHNIVDSFAGDGLRGLGDHTTFQYNVVKNCYDVNDNHDDGFQSWTTGPGGVGTGEVTGIVLRGNLIINYEDENQKYRGTLQGIGCFDGMFVDWVVENNVIVTDHWHGITLLGAKNARIVNNTVLDPNDIKPGPPWIRIANHKNGTPSSGSVVRNNLTTALNLGDGVIEDHNLLIDDPAKFFVDAAGLDLRLRPDAPAIDVGSSELAPSTDIDGIARPQGAGIDVGAYEWHDGSATPTGGAAGSSGAGGQGSGGDAGNDSGGTSAGGAANAGAWQGGNAGTGGGSAGGSPADAGSEDEGGCACRTAATTPPGAAWLFLAALGLSVARRRRPLTPRATSSR